MVMLNDLDRFHLVIDVIDRVPGLGERAGARCASRWSTRGCAHRAYTREHGEDPPEVARLDAGPAAAAPSVHASACASSSSTPARAASSCAARRATTRRSPRASSQAPRARSTPASCARRCDGGLGDADAVGHRIVHGGERFRAPVRDRRRRRARAARRWPTSRRCTSRSRSPRSTRSARRCPDVPAVACFDTAFHATLPAAAATYALPARRGASAGALRRYGFHGLSHAWVARRAPRAARARRAEACGSSAATSAPARRCARSRTGARSTRRWASRRSRAGDGDPLGQRRPGPAAVAARARRRCRARELADALEHESGLLGLAGTRRHARGARPRAGAGDADGDARARRLPAPPARRRSPRWRPRSAASTRSCSPAASASTRRAIRARAAAGLGVPRRRARRRPRNADAAGDADISACGRRRAHARLSAREDLEIARQTRAALARAGRSA